MECVLRGECRATVKWDGSACALIPEDGHYSFYKRYDAKRGKVPPEDAIPCCDPDPVTGHWPHWVLVDPKNKSDQHFINALSNAIINSKTRNQLIGGCTCEAIGKHFNGNPYGLSYDTLVRHGADVLPIYECTFESIQDYLREHPAIEGIVWWQDGEPLCKIRQKDFGFPWPSRIGGMQKYDQ